MCKLKKEKDGKRGGALIFYYLGHGVCYKLFTWMVLNEQQSDAQEFFFPNESRGLYPIESKLRLLEKIKNSVVFATLNCARVDFKTWYFKSSSMANPK